MQANGVNGNGHNKLRGGTPIYVSSEDKGAREIKSPPCAKRLDNGGWCVLVDAHEGACGGLPRRFGPEDSIWHRHRGRMVICGKVTGPDAVCTMQRGHFGTCKS